MLLDSVPIADFPVFSKFDREFNSANSSLSSFLKWPASLSSIDLLIKERSQYPTDRKLVHRVLQDQYARLSANESTGQLIDLILSPTTFTVVTAHQPSLFTGPVFVLSKALSAIKLARQIQSNYSGYTILPVFVIGSEDHDVEELNHCFTFGKKITWVTDQKGPVGRYSLDGIDTVLDEIREILSSSKFGQDLIPLLEKAYNPANNFAEAFQYMLHELLGGFGMLVLNTDDSRFKLHLKSFIKAEITQSVSKPLVQKTQAELKNIGYDPAAFARDINFFYFDKGYRDRIDVKDQVYSIVGQEKQFTSDEMINEIDHYPERFSPNVILRPLCQEIVLPNLAYVGGGGELAYWIERKYQFESLGVPYPMLIRRDSFMIMQQEQFNQLKQFKLTLSDLGTRTDLLLNQVAESLSNSANLLTEESIALMEWMDRIRIKAEAVDKTLGPNIEAEKSKIQKAIEHIEKKLLKAEKIKSEIQLNKIRKLQEKLMPQGNLLERRDNFMTFYADYGKVFMDTLLNDFNPLDGLFKAIRVPD